MSVAVFAGDGAFNFIDVPQHFTFYIYPDGSLVVDMEPIESLNSSNGANNATHVTRSTVIAVNNEEQHGGDNEAENIGGYDQDNRTQNSEQFVYFCADGAAMEVAVAGGAEENDNIREYVGEFKVVRWCRERVDVKVMLCIARFSTVSTVVGSYFDLSEESNDEEGQPFFLPLTSSDTPCHQHRILYRRKQMDQQLFPLTPGKYKLVGYTIGHNDYIYDCQVTLNLAKDGTLSGISKELMFPQECVITGTWSHDQVRYSLDYVMGDHHCKYLYSATTAMGHLRGEWYNENPEAQVSDAERGILEFHLIDSTRIWSPPYHKYYPPAFQRCVKLLLLLSVRPTTPPALSMPSYLWSHIVAFCGYSWFQDDTH